MKRLTVVIGVAALVSAGLFAQELASSPISDAGAAAGLNVQNEAAPADDGVLSAQEISKSIEEVDGIKVFAEVLKNSSDTVASVVSASGVTVLAPVDTVADSEKISKNIADYIVPEKLTKENLESKNSVQTLSGKVLPVEVSDTAILIDNVEISDFSSSADDKVAVCRLSGDFSEKSLALAE
ncbi:MULTISPECIES: fasciclin domain-containing protein [unclassified Treponema]|uniref:fasciclin domain-containing protein n=1 Tax=unclassified Treponema TaxID=2638727 RepID=UPI0025FFD803|nr:MULTISPECIES: fasciclin domain-containing protein [unclassified Treponema]